MSISLFSFAGTSPRWDRGANIPAPHAGMPRDRSGIVPHDEVQPKEPTSEPTHLPLIAGYPDRVERV
jgi:hypothetical protein